MRIGKPEPQKFARVLDLLLWLFSMLLIRMGLSHDLAANILVKWLCCPSASTVKGNIIARLKVNVYIFLY